MKLFRGLYTALVTPFDAQGKVNESMLRQLLRFQIEAEVDGIVVLGTTGETPTLTEEEQEAIVAIAREETVGKLPLLVGTGSYSTAKTIEYTRQAKNLGADGALVVTPYYSRPSQEGLYQHYMALADAVDLPIIVYNIQGRTGQNLQTDILQRLAAHPNICGVKEASASHSQIMDVIEQIGRRRPNFAILSGDDAMTFSCTMLGGDGIISVASNLIPVSIRQLTRAALAGDVQEARRLHYELMPLFRALFIDTNPIPLKAAMNFSGLNVGGYRLPLCAMSAQNQEKLCEILASLDDLLRENGLFQSRKSAIRMSSI